MTDRMSIAIIGGGIGGLATSIALRGSGIETHVFEAKPNFDELGVALVLSPNGMKALDALDESIGGAVREAGHAVAGEFGLPHCSPDGRTWGVLDHGDLVTSYGAPQVTIRRADLHRILLRAHTEEGLHANAELVRFDASDGGIAAGFKDGSTFRADAMVGADGINSVVRAELHGAEPARYSGTSSLRGITAGVDLPPEWAAAFAMVGDGVVLVGWPLPAGALYWSAVVQIPAGTWPYDPEQARQALLTQVHRWTLLPEVIRAADPTTLSAREIRDRPPLAHWSRGRVTLVGDAAHPMTNFWGQGANVALEDTIVLANCLGATTNPATAFTEYERLRIPRTTRIVDASFEARRDAEGRPWKEFVDWLYGYDPPARSRDQC